MNSTNKKPYICRCVWDDISFHSGWREPGEKFTLYSAVTVGFLIRAEKSYVVIAETIAEDAKLSGVLCIPLSVIKELKILTNAGWRRTKNGKI